MQDKCTDSSFPGIENAVPMHARIDTSSRCSQAMIDDLVPSNHVKAPGQSNDNGTRSYQAIFILSAPGEINLTKRPSLRITDEIDDLELTCPTQGFEGQDENQFCLPREDIGSVVSLRRKGALGNERKSVSASSLQIFSLPISTLSSVIDEEDWRARLEKERNTLLHGSFACLLSGSEVVTLVTAIYNCD